MVITIGDYRFPITYVLKLKNIGIIKEACIEFGGLTVIAGENDTGKSTVGKLLYSVIKSINNYKEELERIEIEKIYEIFTILAMTLPKLAYQIGKSDNPKTKIEIEKIYKSFHTLVDYLRVKAKSGYRLSDDDEFNSKLKEIKEMIMLSEISAKQKNFLLDVIKQISEIAHKEESKDSVIKRVFNKIIMSEFYGELSNKILNGESLISISIDENEILKITLKNNKLRDLNLIDNKILYNDTIYIETPLILNLHNIIEFSKNKKIIPYHLEDIIMNLRYAKLTNIPSLLEEENEEKKLIDEISSIIGGTLEYSDTHEDFIYTKNINENNYSFRSINIATGIKSLGIIQLLLKSGLLNNRTILIIDEPEVHLHPEWQLKYAEIIVKLVKYGVPVIISSHSPYMIQALRYYAMKEEIDDITKFYLAEKDNDGLVKIKDVTDDLNQIFQKLAKPLGKVM